MGYTPTIAIITRETRLQGLVARWGTKGAAKFRLRTMHAHERELRAGQGGSASSSPADEAAADAAEFTAYEQEDQVYRETLNRLNDELNVGLPITHVARDFLANYDFFGCLVAVVVGQDGLVANAAKYVGDVPILAVNPDPQRIDGVLLPFQVQQVRKALQQVMKGTAPIRDVSLAEAEFNDGQRLLAFNDLFIGCNGHASARYLLTADGRTEPQSSSGMIVSTGAGSTGWLSSMFNMYSGFARWMGGPEAEPFQLAWEDPRLAWVVREPFRSKQSEVGLVAGLLEAGNELVIESMMPSRGVIFSDGIESDFLEFNSGTLARIRRAAQRAKLICGESR